MRFDLGFDRGFSLVELMAVVAILGILITIALPRYHSFVVRSRRGEAKANLASIAALQKIKLIDKANEYYGSIDKVGYCQDEGCNNNEGSKSQLDNELGFQPENCDNLRYCYRAYGVKHGSNVVLATAWGASNGDNHWIYPDCAGAGNTECGKSSGDRLLVRTGGKPEVCRNIIKYCPGNGNSSCPSCLSPYINVPTAGNDCNCACDPVSRQNCLSSSGQFDVNGNCECTYVGTGTPLTPCPACTSPYVQTGVYEPNCQCECDSAVKNACGSGGGKWHDKGGSPECECEYCEEDLANNECCNGPHPSNKVTCNVGDCCENTGSGFEVKACPPGSPPYPPGFTAFSTTGTCAHGERWTGCECIANCADCEDHISGTGCTEILKRGGCSAKGANYQWDTTNPPSCCSCPTTGTCSVGYAWDNMVACDCVCVPTDPHPDCTAGEKWKLRNWPDGTVTCECETDDPCLNTGQPPTPRDPATCPLHRDWDGCDCLCLDGTPVSSSNSSCPVGWDGCSCNFNPVLGKTSYKCAELLVSWLSAKNKGRGNEALLDNHQFYDNSGCMTQDIVGNPYSIYPISLIEKVFDPANYINLSSKLQQLDSSDFKPGVNLADIKGSTTPGEFLRKIWENRHLIAHKDCIGHTNSCDTSQEQIDFNNNDCHFTIVVDGVISEQGNACPSR